MKQSQGYVLVTPGGIPVAYTFSVYKEKAESAAYEHLASTRRWAKDRKYWKEWDAFVKERERRGWIVEKAQIFLGW